MTEQVDVVVLKVQNFKKSGKSSIQYGLKEKANDFSKGVTVLSQWFDDSRAYDNIPDELILQPLKASIYYERGYDGKATIKLADLFDEHGVSLFSK